MSISRFFAIATFFLVSGCSSHAVPPIADAPIEIKTVVLVNFEVGSDSGDAPGEFQHWFERGIDGNSPLSCVELTFSTHSACLDRQHGVLVTYTGLTADKAAASVMALGLDPRFDFSHSYWLIGGIAGIDADDGSLGSAVWGKWVVNGDWAHEIDAREMPTNWETGYTPFGRIEPFPQPVNDAQGKVFALNPQLADWAYTITKNTALATSKMMQSITAEYTEQAAAQLPPTVMQGDNVSSNTFWHGAILNKWANDWVEYWTEGKGEFVTSAVEDSGILEAIRFLEQGKRARLDRVMLLRTASNYTTPPPHLDASTNLAREMSGFGAMGPAVENHWRVGSKVVRRITNNWSEWRDKQW